MSVERSVMKEIKDLTLQEVQEILEKEAERGKSFTDENLRYLNEIVMTKERKRFNGIIAFLEDCKKYDIMRMEDGIEPVVFADKKIKDDGLLIKLPCKVGDILWSTTKNFVSEKIPLRTFPCMVREIRIKYCNCVYLVLRADINDITYHIWWNDIKVPVDKIGKTIFLTEQEAEESLKENI